MGGGPSKKRRGGATADIIGLCLRLDRKATRAYAELAKNCPDAGLKAFWRKKSGEEAEHVKFWEKALGMAKAGDLPEVFSDPLRVKADLEAALHQADTLLMQSRAEKGVSSAFFLAFRLEFYVMHPSLATLFRYVDKAGGNMEEAYDNHIDDLVGLLGEYERASPELQFLGQTIKHLWRDSKRLAAESATDPLTGLLNRQGLFNFMAVVSHMAERRHEAVGLMMVDIDDFKKINDTHGHQAGDRVLSRVAKAIKSNVRASDIAGRYGGEEFCVFVYPAESGPLLKMGEKLARAVAKETMRGLPATVSIGVASGLLGRNVQKDVEALLKRADDCLYKAKAAGKNRCVSCDV